MSKLLAHSLLLAAIAPAITLACSSSNAEPQGLTPDEAVAYCRLVDSTRESLGDVRGALVPLDHAAMQSARADVRADISYLESLARDLEGGSDLIADLQTNLFGLQELIATPDLLSVVPEIQAQVQLISGDLDELAATGDCP